MKTDFLKTKCTQQHCTDIKLDTKYCHCHWQDYKTHDCVFIRLRLGVFISAICTSTAECLDSVESVDTQANIYGRG